MVHEGIMAYFLFVDESGQDHRDSPYEVLAGVAVKDRDLWTLVQTIQEAEVRILGRRYTVDRGELKGTKLLKRKVFRHAAQLPPIPNEERRLLSMRCLEDGAIAGMREITALAQAKIAYAEEVLEICVRSGCKAFASIVSRNAPAPPSSQNLRKDYSYLFERFFYFLQDHDPEASGIVVFDELEKSHSHLLVGQMDRYFRFTAKGRQRAGQIIPEPFFVHSELTTGIQIADLVAYLVSWGFRRSGMQEPARQELAGLVDRVCQMRYRARREVQDNPNFLVWSFAVIGDLRSREHDEA
jgi:Protein of unknown function (DUF3800)